MLATWRRLCRWLAREQAERLLAELLEHLATMARLSLATGLRTTNITGLEWRQVDMACSVVLVHPDQAKGEQSIPVPSNNEARMPVILDSAAEDCWLDPAVTDPAILTRCWCPVHPNGCGCGRWGRQ
jgi:integrase